MRIIARVVVLLVGLTFVGSADAILLCVAKDATGGIKEGARVFLRSACRPKERALPISIEDDAATVRITGANLQVVDGTGDTDGVPNGLGNVIVGYDEGRCRTDTGEFAAACQVGDTCDSGPCDVDLKTGSHNLIVGGGHQYPSSGGFAAGAGNVVGAPSASVSGGVGGRASGSGASVVGGLNNQATGLAATVAGGEGLRAGERSASALGGYANSAQGAWSTVVGGSDNTAQGLALAAGGSGNRASGEGAAVVGGVESRATGPYATVAGGSDNIASGTHATVCGGGGNEAAAQGASVSGGAANLASGAWSSVSGGRSRTAPSTDNWAAGSLLEPN